MRWTVIEQAGKPVTSGPSALLTAPGGTIGRSPDNHLVLPDEQRQISRLQATVRFDAEGAAILRNMSAVLAISVNDRLLGHEQESSVVEGDRLTIGSYVLMVGAAPPVAAPPAIASAPAALAPIRSLPPSPPPPPLHAAPARPIASGQAPSGPDVFSDLFGEGALPLGDAAGTTVAMPPPMAAVAAVQPEPPPPPPAPPPPPPAAPPPYTPPVVAAVPAPPPAASTPAVPRAAPTTHAIPTAADWDAILANAPRHADNVAAPMPDPLAHEPFSLPSQASRNPVDPLAALNPDADRGLPDMASRRGVDPLAFFAADKDAPSPLSDPRPTALTHDTALTNVHPALDLLVPAALPTQGRSQPNHARETTSQFRPPMPVMASPAAPVADPAPAPAVALEPVPSAVDVPPPPAATVAPPPSPPAPVAPPPPAVPSADTGREAAPAPAPAPTMPRTTEPAAPAESAAPGAGASPDALFAAFLEGAGVPDVAGQQPVDLESMRHLGRLMRAFTDGTIDLLSSRALLKREVRAEITMIVDEENNPFKILPNGRAVLMQMFGARMPDFLTPEAAVNDALGDLQSHQLGMVAGMRAALLTLLQRFDPAALGRDTPHDGGVGEKWLPGGRDARLWRQMQQLHAQTTAAVEDDFHAVFGRAFQKAYDREMERLKDARRA